jgi:hypothetical protein
LGTVPSNIIHKLGFGSSRKLVVELYFKLKDVVSRKKLEAVWH